MFLDVDQLCVSYPKRANPSVDRVTLGLHAGQMGVLIGSSGCGKTSLLRAVAGLEQASAGEIRLAQSVVSSANEHVAPEARQIGMVFQDFALFPHLTVHDNVSFGLNKQPPAQREARVREVLALVGLSTSSQRYPHELSGGQQQRVALARAIVNKPAILLADEPTGNLDPNTSADIVNLLEKISQSGTTIVMATHDVGIVDRLKRRVIELKHGVIVRDDKKSGYETALPNTDQVQTIEPSGEQA